MDAFDAAWSVLKSNTLPIRPKVMQYATDQKKTMRLKQPGGVARSARRKLMDETQARKNDKFTDEPDIMNQYEDREHEPYEMFRDESEDFQEARMIHDAEYRDMNTMTERQIHENEWNDLEHFNEYPPHTWDVNNMLIVPPSERKDGR